MTLNNEEKNTKTVKKSIVKSTEKVAKKENTQKKDTVKKVSTKKVADESKETKEAVVKTVKLNAEKKATPKKIEIKAKVKKEEPKKPTLDKQGRAYATGKRKDAIAKVWLKKGTGIITVNGMPAGKYLKRPILEVMINVPFEVTKTQGEFDVVCEALGGGLSGQAGAIRHGIAKALENFNIIYRPELKTAGLLTRDARVVERKKAGLIKARKGQVYKRR